MIKSKISKTLYWTPRILALLLVLFLTVFSWDVFDSCNNFFNCTLGLFIHNIPALVLAILLWASWKREVIGAITFIIAGLLYITLLIVSAIISGKFEWYIISWSMVLAGPSFFIGYLFWLNWKKHLKTH